MIVMMNSGSDNELKEHSSFFEASGLRTYTLSTSRGQITTLMGPDNKVLEQLPKLSSAFQCMKPNVPYVLASKTIKDTPTIIRLPNGTSIGGNSLVIMAGPCSVESENQMAEAARAVKESGASVLRGGAFKPRSSPYAFQGLGIEGLKMLRNAADSEGLSVVTEVMDSDDIPVICDYADILQVGARNCQNFALLKKVGRAGKPVLLKRGMMTTIEEFLMAAEYILSEGNMNVILCERGIRTFETETRNTLDISAIPVLKSKTHLPVVVDPSHAAGDWKLIEPLAMAAVAAGADGLIIEVHPTPETALCDGKQSLRPEKFASMMKKINQLSTMMAAYRS